MFTVYILYSTKFNQIYICYTSDLANRFLSHNELATKGHTIKYRPWVIAYTEEFQTKTEAIKRENYLKINPGQKIRLEYYPREIWQLRWLTRRIHIRPSNCRTDGSSILLPATFYAKATSRKI